MAVINISLSRLERANLLHSHPPQADAVSYVVDAIKFTSCKFYVSRATELWPHVLAPKCHSPKNCTRDKVF